MRTSVVAPRRHRQPQHIADREAEDDLAHRAMVVSDSHAAIMPAAGSVAADVGMPLFGDAGPQPAFLNRAVAVQMALLLTPLTLDSRVIGRQSDEVVHACDVAYREPE
jgi:hypothetical protein